VQLCSLAVCRSEVCCLEMKTPTADAAVFVCSTGYELQITTTSGSSKIKRTYRNYNRTSSSVLPPDITQASMEEEGTDRVGAGGLGLPGVQLELLQALQQTGTPVASPLHTTATLSIEAWPLTCKTIPSLFLLSLWFSYLSLYLFGSAAYCCDH
jgi:hypothetical protein